MKRYLSSFIISIVLYSPLVGAFLYYISTADSLRQEPQLHQESRVKVSLLAIKNLEPVKSVPKKMEAARACKTPAKKKLKKECPKQKVVKKIVTQRSTQEIVKTQILMARAKEAAIMHEKEQQKRALLKKILKEKQVQKREAELLFQKQNLFFAQLREAINKNKSYPNTARRRNIQGDVRVKFFILASGDVKGIKMLEGDSIFKRSVYEAIENSFPIIVEKSLFHFPKEFQLTLSYILK